MTNKDTPLALATEIEELTEPSRELDARIWCDINKIPFYLEGERLVTVRDGEEDFVILFGGASCILGYTTSLDAAYSLVPSGWSPKRLDWLIDDTLDFELIFHNLFDFESVSSNAKTHCHAVIAASLRAMASEMDAQKSPTD